MAYLSFLLKAIFISLSGVMAPGPLTTVTISKGNESPHSGGLIALGHGIIEFPLMIIILFGFGRLFSITYTKMTIGILGGILLIWLGFGMLKSFKNISIAETKASASALGQGVALTIGNPYFLIWWATIGATLAVQAAEFGVIGFIIFMLVHWSCDLIWLYLLSTLAFNGKKFFGNLFQKASFLICGLLLFYFGLAFIFDASKELFK